MMMMSSSMRNHDESPTASNPTVELGRSKSTERDNLKCGLACFYLPGLHKRKSLLQIRSSAQHTPESTVASGASIFYSPGKTVASGTDTLRVSTTLSIERFECSSSSSGIDFNLEEEGWRSPFYDLPVELIRKSIDSESPMNATFVFDFEPNKSMKAKGPPSLPQSKSLYVNKSRDNKLIWSPSSCPASPSSVPRNRHRLSKAEENLTPFMN